MAECNICGKEFDSERGLNIHKSQVHTGEDEEQSDSEENSGKSENQKAVSYNDGSFDFQLSATHALIGVFLVGLVTGGFGHAVLDDTVLTGNTQELMDGPGDTDTNPQPSGNEDNGDQEPAQPDSNTINMDDIPLEGEPMLGDQNAPVTMVVYEDFQCPFCQQFEQNAMPQIVNNYVESGQVRVVWKDLPLPQIGHEWAEPAAEAMECVYRQDEDAFWNVKSKVFDNQNTIARSNVQSKIKDYASQEGVSSSAVQSCIDNDNPMDEVNSDSQEAQQLGVSGTPTIVIDGEKIVGAQPYSNFEQVIENKLNN